jgi:FAD binding domain/Berberine and berberine like
MSVRPAIGEAAVHQLDAVLAGDVITPDHLDYDEARAVWNGLIDKRPALIARCKAVADVIQAVDFARANAMTVAVRGGGHSAVGYSTCDDGIVIDVSPMKGLKIDPDRRTAQAQAGLTWGEFDAATQQYGLAVTGGRFSTTGIAGLTLGSGSGWLERKCGLTGDNLIEAELVTADGSVLKASATENPDLFWGIRGGGGNFGIVTSFTFRLHEVGPIVYGGLMACPPERATEIMRFMRDYMKDAPDDFGGAVAFISAPPEEFVPPEAHGAPMVGIVVCWTGPLEDGEKVVAPIREVAQPLVDMVQPIPYTALQSMLDGGGPHGTRGYMKAEFMEELTDDAIDVALEHGARRPGPLVNLLFEPMGGAISHVGEDDTALGRRDVAWCYHALGMWMEPDEATERSHVAWTRGFAEAMAPHTVPGVYMNYTSDQGEERVRSTYGPVKYERLVALKDKYDPGNMFRLNGNIRPSMEAAARADQPA